MTEQALQQYLIKQYPKEDEGCEWKEFKNLKNDFSGHEKDDVISYVSALANMEGGHLVVGVEDKTLRIVGTDTYNYTTQQATLRLTNLCANLSSEGLDIEKFITEDTHKTVWVIHIPKHQPKLPVYAHNKAWQRIEDSLVELTPERLNAILEETSPTYDWSAEIVAEATLDDLEPMALQKAREEYKSVHPKLATEVDTWDDMELLGSTSLLVLYENGKPDKLSAYKIVDQREIGKDELIGMGYPNKKPRKSYMSFSLEPLDMDLTFLVEHHLIERIIELDADHAKGTPIFIEP